MADFETDIVPTRNQTLEHILPDTTRDQHVISAKECKLTDENTESDLTLRKHDLKDISSKELTGFVPFVRKSPTDEDSTSMEVNLGDGSSRRESDISNLSLSNLIPDGDGKDEDDNEVNSQDDTEDDLDEEIPGIFEKAAEKDLAMHFDVGGTMLRVQRATPNFDQSEPEGDVEESNEIHKEAVAKLDHIEKDGSDKPNDDSLLENAHKSVISETSTMVENGQIADSGEDARDSVEGKNENFQEQQNGSNTKVARLDTEKDRETDPAKASVQKNLDSSYRRSPGMARRLIENSTAASVDSNGLSNKEYQEIKKYENENDESTSRNEDLKQSQENGENNEHLVEWIAKTMPSGKEEEKIETKPTYVTLDELSKQGVDDDTSDVLKEWEINAQQEGVKQFDQMNEEDSDAVYNEILQKAVREGVVSVENEYDYVKYAESDAGNMYVGMRLAASLSADSVVLSLSSVESSREPSPEKTLQGSPQKHQQKLKNVQEEDLSSDKVLDGAMLPDLNTECDSINSLPSDMEKGPILVMPMVEDGLSSGSQPPSDEESSDQNGCVAKTQTPAHFLRSQQKARLSNETQTSLQKTRSNDVLKDITSTLKQAKKITPKSPYHPKPKPLGADEPVWILRETYMEQIKQQDELRKKRDELARIQEAELRREQEEAVGRLMEEDENLVVRQFAEAEGKKYQGLKGYESGDDSDLDEHEFAKASFFSRRKKYTTLPIDDDDESNDISQHAPPCMINQSAYYEKSSSDIGARLSNNQDNKPKMHQLYIHEATTHTNINGHQSSANAKRAVSQGHDRPRRFIPDNNSLSNRYSASDSDSEYYNEQPELPGQTTYVKKERDSDTDEETDQLLDKQYARDPNVDIPEIRDNPPVMDRTAKAKEVAIYDPEKPEVLIEGVLFRASYLGSTQLISEGQPSKAMRLMQAQEAVGRIKAPEGESQPCTDVDLFVSTEKIMVLNTDLQEIMMDHALKTISYIADIDDIIVIMARRRMMSHPGDELLRKKQCKILCHVFQSDEAHLISQSIGQAFQVAYMEFLKANGIEDPGLLTEIDYQEVLNQQEIFGEELNMFSNKENQREVVVPKSKGEILGVVIVESGWGSLVPTVVVANMSPGGAAARGGLLNIGDQIISINGISLVGLPLLACQNYIKATKNQTVIQLTVVSCPPVVEVCVKRPDIKYQLGFSVQNGVICSLLRGGIAERGGVRVGHRIIEINSDSVVAVPHEKIVNLLSTSVGEIRMKTMPTSIYRLLTGQEIPHYI